MYNFQIRKSHLRAAMLHLQFQVKMCGTVSSFHSRLKRCLLQCSGRKLLRWLMQLHNHHLIENVFCGVLWFLECSSVNLYKLLNTKTLSVSWTGQWKVVLKKIIQIIVIRCFCDLNVYVVWLQRKFLGLSTCVFFISLTFFKNFHCFLF